MSNVHDALTKDLNRIFAKPADKPADPARNDKGQFKAAAPVVDAAEALRLDKVADYEARKSATSNPDMKRAFDKAIAELTPAASAAPRLSEAERKKLRLEAIAKAVTGNPFVEGSPDFNLSHQSAILQTDAPRAAVLQAAAAAVGYKQPFQDVHAIPPRR